VQKMGKSLNNYVAITEPAEEQFGKLMSIPDARVEDYARLCTDLPPADIEALGAAAAAGGPAANAAKRRMAAEIIRLYHGADAAAKAESHFDALFREHAVPDDVPTHPLPAKDPVHLPALLTTLGFAASNGAGRRLVDGGGVRVDGTAVTDYDVPRAELAGRVLAAGRRRLVRLVD
jgi:tyrosyl-tRNA synthetase